MMIRRVLRPTVHDPRSRTIQLAYTSTHTGTPALAPPPSRTESLSGTVPYHNSYLLLHTPQSPGKWPSIFISRLYFELQKIFKEKDGLVNFCWRPSKLQGILGEDAREEAYGATFWKMPRRGGLARHVEIPIISNNNMGEILDELFSDDWEMNEEPSSELSFYVCTHAGRDCRCGVRGGEFAESLRKGLGDRGMLLDRAGKSRVCEVGHVGGHKNAPNLIVFPQGDWYGNLEQSDIPVLLDHWLQASQRAPTSVGRLADGPNILQWRGRMGMTKEVQVLSVVGRT